jgi:hypothetical protein
MVTFSIGSRTSASNGFCCGSENRLLVISIPRDFKVDIAVRGDELKKEDLVKIKNQFNRWIEGLEEAFED